jgi:cephalosporin hydroxylase
MKNNDVQNIVSHCLSECIINKNYIQQVKEEFTILAYFLKSFQPHNILEIGCKGGTFYMFNTFSTGKKVGLDIDDQYFLNMHFYTHGEDFQFIKGDSHLQETVDLVRQQCTSYDFIFIDGDHSYDGVKCDFDLYKPFLSPRGYIGFHDIDPNHVFRDNAGGQVYKFWQELDYGSKTEIICSKSNSNYTMGGHKEHFGGIGLWQP